jgi:glycerol kinase
MPSKYILALDQGTTSSRAILFDHSGSIVHVSQKEFRQIFPEPGWVEHDPEEIWATQYGVMMEVLAKAKADTKDIAAIGITNQRETTIVWDRTTGKPIYNAIVWQDRRTSGFCDQLRKAGHSEMIRNKTGLVIDAYFSATKLKWILDNVPEAKQKAERGELAFGTVDSWLVWKLTGGKMHITDVSNASRTMLLNIRDVSWDNDLLTLFEIPASILPQVMPSSQAYGVTDHMLLKGAITIGGIAGDQQAALFGQQCIEPGMVKNTYGTGCFMLMNTGTDPVVSKNNLLTTIAWKIGDQTTYALEGSVFIAGAVVQWIRDGLELIRQSSEVEKLAASVPDSGGVYMVPAFAGLGAPYWNPYARGSIFGITRGTTKGHMARAALESIAFQTLDVLKAMTSDATIPIRELRVDGGATINNFLMQFQSDLLQTPVVRPKVYETTALGAAFLAGLSSGFWPSPHVLQKQWQEDLRFVPGLAQEKVDKAIRDWQRAVRASIAWADAGSDQR